MKYTIALLAIAALALACSPPTYKSCATAPKFKVNSLTFSPQCPTGGDTVNATVSFTLSETISGGNINYEASLGGIQIVKKSEAICSALAKSKYPCPVSAGTYSITDSAKIPSYAPSGTYNGKVTATDQNGAQIACFTATYDMP